MPTVIWSTTAIDDLTEIAKKTESISPAYSSNVVKKLLDRPDILKTMPEIGRIVPETEDDDPSVRELLEGYYRIIYRYRHDTVTILKVVTSRIPLK
jgi:toxin ParE1/3/4